MFNEQQQIIIGTSVHNTHIYVSILQIAGAQLKADFKTEYWSAQVIDIIFRLHISFLTRLCPKQDLRFSYSFA